MATVDQVDRNSGNLTIRKTFIRSAFAAGGTNSIWTPAAGSKINLRYMTLTASGATVLTVKIGIQTIVEFDMTASWPIAEFAPPDDMVVQSALADSQLTVTSSAAVTVGCTALGYEST